MTDLMPVARIVGRSIEDMNPCVLDCCAELPSSFWVTLNPVGRMAEMVLVGSCVLRLYSTRRLTVVQWTTSQVFAMTPPQPVPRDRHA